MKNKTKKMFLIICVLLVVAIVTTALWFSLRRTDKTDYISIKVERGNLKVTVATTGTVKPQNRVEIKPPIAGRIEELLINEGEVVHKGQILGFLSSTDRAALLDAARAKGKEELAHWEQLYKPMPIIAPVDGNIIARNVEPGQTVTANEKMLVMSDRLIVQAQIDETDIGRVKTGQAAELNLDAYPAETINGMVDQIAYEALTVNNVTMYMVDILPNSVPAFMRSGMTANIMLVTTTTNNVLNLPSAALHSKGKDTIVWQADPANGKKVIHTRITTGMNDGKRVEIVSGLKEGDEVLITPTRMPGSKKTEVNPFSPVRSRGR